MKVGIYARVSTKDKGQEVENQLRQLREFAALQGWTVYREYIDHETAKTDDRAEFQSMFRDASQRKFDVLLFWALDRLSREGVLETLQHLNRLTSYGVGYRSFTEQYFDSCGIFKAAVIAIVATVAKQERVRISERVKAGLETARAKGKRLGRPRVIVDTRRIATLRQSGHSWSQIAERTGGRKGRSSEPSMRRKPVLVEQNCRNYQRARESVQLRDRDEQTMRPCGRRSRPSEREYSYYLYYAI